MSLNPLQFPTLTTYLAGLPEGLSSHPAAQVKGSIVRDARIPKSLAAAAGLPPELRELVANPPPASVWLSEVHYQALLHALYDQFYGESRLTEFTEWAIAANRVLLSSPLYRIAFRLVSPVGLTRSLQARWELLRRGSELKIESMDSTSCVLRLKHPLGLYSELHRHLRAIAIRVALEFAGAKGVTTEISDVTLVSWQVFCRWGL